MKIKKKAIFLLEELEDNYVVSDLYANQHRLTKPLKEELEEYKYKKGEKTLFSKLIKKIEKLHQNKTTLKAINKHRSRNWSCKLLKILDFI